MIRNSKKHHTGRIISLLLALCIITTFLPIAAFATTSNTASISVTFRQGSEDNGWIEIKNGTEWTRYNGPEAQNAEAVRIRPNTDYSVDWTGIGLYVNDENILTDGIREQLVNENGYTLAEGIQYALADVEFRQGNGGPGPEPGGEPAHGGYEGVQKTASVTVTGKADFYINDSRMVNSEGGTYEVDYTYNDGGTVDFYFNCFVSERIITLKVNGVDYYNNLPNPSTEEGKAALLAACKGQLNEFKITVPYSESGYAIEASVKWLDDTDKDYMVVGNFLWTYEDENRGDDYIDHGRMELLGVNYNSTDYSPDDLNNPGTAIDWGQDESGGGAVLPVGAVVTVKLIPDYGYQLTSFGINGGNFGNGDEQSVFTFEIKPGNAHLGAHFTPVADKVTSSSDIVASGSITLGSGLSGGSAQLEISDAESELSDEKLAAFKAAAGNYTITDYLNLDLYNVYYKGSTDEKNVWKKEVNTLDDDATISVSLDVFSLGATVEASNIVIIHNIHNGEDFETIPVDSYDSETNTITFKTDSFSTYAIATTYSHGFDIVDKSIDNSSVNVTCKIVVKDKATGKTESKEIRTLKPTGGVTVETVSTICDETVEKAKTVLSEYVELMKKDNPKLQITVMGNPEVSGDATPFDNRTYTMKLNANNQRYLHIEGDYGTKAVYVVSLTVETEEIKLPVYNFLEGADSSWAQNSDGTLTFRINGDFSKFTGVKVDDTLIDAKNYTAVSGSTVITLKADYLKTLSVGTHKLTAVYNDGECGANFEVKSAQTENGGGSNTEKAPQTGDNSMIWLWIVLLVVSGSCIVGFLIHNRKKRINN